MGKIGELYVKVIPDKFTVEETQINNRVMLLINDLLCEENSCSNYAPVIPGENNYKYMDNLLVLVSENDKRVFLRTVNTYNGYSDSDSCMFFERTENFKNHYITFLEFLSRSSFVGKRGKIIPNDDNIELAEFYNKLNFSIILYESDTHIILMNNVSDGVYVPDILCKSNYKSCEYIPISDEEINNNVSLQNFFDICKNKSVFNKELRNRATDSFSREKENRTRIRSI